MDNKSKKSLNAAIWYMASNFISKALLYIFTPLYTRLLTTAQYGEYSNFLSWQNILVTLLTFDLGASIAIAYYDYENEDDFNGFVNTISIFSYIIPGVFCLAIYIFGDQFSEVFSIQKKYLLLLLIYITCNNTLNIFQADQRVRLKYKMSSLLTLGTSLASAAATLLLALSFNDKLYGILLGGVILNVIVSLILAIHIFHRGNVVKLSYLKYSLMVAVPLVPHVLAGTILGSSDKVMITRYCGEEYTALYSLAYTISLIITMIASSINKAWVPWFFDRLKTNTRGQIKRVSNFVVGGIAVLSLGACLLAPEVLRIIGGKPYVSASALMPPVIVACFINCVSTFYINIEFYNKKTAGISIATVISALINVLLNYFLIRKYGYMAAAYTTLFSSVLALLFHLYKVRRQKMWDVFDNKFLLGLSFATTIFCEAIILTYSNYIVRYIIVLIIVIVCAGFVVKNKTKVKAIIDNIIPRRRKE